MSDSPQDPAAPPQLPAAVRDKLRQEAERTVPAAVAKVPLAARLRLAGAAAQARLANGQASLRASALPPQIAERLKAGAAARPAWLSLRKVQVSPEVRGEIIDRGRRAGVSIGTALDSIVRQMPASRRPAATVPVDPEADIATVAVQRAVKRPSIFDPGHILTALLTAGIVHIATTFSITALGTGSAYKTLRGVLPVNELVVMPAQTPGAQVLPFLAPDMLYAFCRFDLARGPIEISALLPEAGWSLALYTRHGDNFYATPGQVTKPITANFVLAPATDRLINLTPGVRKNDVDASQVTSPDQEGLLVIRAPLKGVAFVATAQTELKRSKCAPFRRGNLPAG
jgi:uncharacterized membrane protein